MNRTLLAGIGIAVLFMAMLLSVAGVITLDDTELRSPLQQRQVETVCGILTVDGPVTCWEE